MKLTIMHASHISNKIALDMVKSDIITIETNMEDIAEIAKNVIEEDIRTEQLLDGKVNEILESYSDDIDDWKADEKRLFGMIKKEVAEENNIILNSDDRYNKVAHTIMDRLIEDEVIDFIVSETVVKNLIHKSILDYKKGIDSIDDIVTEKLKNYKKKLIRGTEEYDLIYERLFHEELAKKGFV